MVKMIGYTNVCLVNIATAKLKTQEQGTVRNRGNYYLCPECSNDFIRFLYNLTVTADTEEQKKGE